MSFFKISEILKNISPWQFVIHLSPEFSSSVDNYRLSLRQELKSRYLFKNDILELGLTPVPMKGSLSISHCNDLGGFVFCDARQVGFDIEQRHRITKKIVDRISTPNEINHNFDSAVLWTAKESAFKAARMLDTEVLKNIEVLSVSELQENIFRFKAHIPSKSNLIDGVVELTPEHSIAIAWIKNLST